MMRGFSRAIGVCAAGTLAALTSPVLAQNSTVAGAEESSEAIVVTARRKAEALQDVPLAITALDSAALDRQSIGELRDLSAIAPSLVIKEHTNNPQGLVVSLRGQVPAGILMTLDSAVGLYSDGISVPRAVGLRGALVDLARVEVLRGPQGTLYGRNTTGGAISLISNAPTDRLEGSLSLSAGSYGAINGTGVINLPIGEHLASRFVVQRGFRDGFGRDGLGRDLNDENSTFLRGRLRGSWDRLTVDLIGEFSRYKQGGAMARVSGIVPGNTLAIREIAAELGLPMTAPSPGFLRGVPATPEALATAQAAFAAYMLGNGPDFRNGGTQPLYSNFRGENVTLDILLEATDELKIRSLSGYRHHKRDSRDDLDTSPFNVVRTAFGAYADFYSQELQLLGDFGNFNFVVGGYASREKGYEGSSLTTFEMLLANPTSNFDGFVKNESLGAFGQANWQITDKLAFTGGVRYSREKKGLVSINSDGLGGCLVPVALRDDAAICRATLSRTDSKPSWLASLEYKAMPGVLAYAKFVTGFRAGGHNMRGARTLASFAPFGPETVTEYEAGLKTTLFDRALIFNIAAFHDDYSDVQRTITVRTETGSATTIVTNAAQAKIDGVEIEATLRPARGLTFSGSVSYVDARYKRFIDVTGDRTKEDWPTPDWTYSVSARYEASVPLGQLAFQLDYQGQSRQNLYPAGLRTDETSQNAYGILNGRISLNVEDEGVEISVFGRNLANKTYAAGAFMFESVGYNLKYLGAPRELGVQLVKKF